MSKAPGEQDAAAATDEVVRLNADEIVDSLTGWDEIAVEQQFGTPFTKLSDTMGARAIVFVHHRRNGMSDGDAKITAMATPLGRINAMLDPGDGDGEGKDSAASESAPTPTS